MFQNTAELIQLLRQTPFFSESESAALRRLADLFIPVTFTDGQVIFEPGDLAEQFYLLAKGKVRLEREMEAIAPGFANLSKGDYFGEEALWVDDPRFYRAVGIGEVVVFSLDVRDYLTIFDAFPEIENMLEVSVRSRRLALKLELPWLGEDEFVDVISRCHPAILAARLVIPSSIGLLSVLLSILLLWLWMPGRSIGWLTLGIGTPVSVVWTLWTYFDWRNDYILLTNKRVVRLEKVALVYDSRQEAPLRTIMSVGLQKTRLGSLLGFADVVVQTYVGTLRLGDLARAEVIAAMIEAFWHRAENRDLHDEAVLMDQKLRQKLDGFPKTSEDGRPDVSERLKPHLPLDEPAEPGFFPWLFGDFIRLRYEQNGAITYRKHWFMLVKHISLPFILMVVAFAVLVMRLGGLLAFLPMPLSFIGLSLVIFATFLWSLYQYADWRDDIFQVTADQIVDFDRKPLGKMRRRAAPLENVLSIEYERRGFWGYVFNFGTVYISVGNDRLTFDYVYNPSAVQQDIFFQMGERVEEIRQFEIDSERERVSEWIATYHRRTRVQHAPEEDTRPNEYD